MVQTTLPPTLSVTLPVGVPARLVLVITVRFVTLSCPKLTFVCDRCIVVMVTAGPPTMNFFARDETLVKAREHELLPPGEAEWSATSSARRPVNPRLAGLGSGLGDTGR